MNPMLIAVSSLRELCTSIVLFHSQMFSFFFYFLIIPLSGSDVINLLRGEIKKKQKNTENNSALLKHILRRKMQYLK